MRLPNTAQAFVEREKITEYLLNAAHRYGSSKAEFFAVRQARRIEQAAPGRESPAADADMDWT